MSEFLQRLAWWRRRRVTEEELREELEFHLAEEAAERQEDGLSPQNARRIAHLDLGNTQLIREDVRTLWTWTALEQVAQDARYALRTMVRYRLVVGLAILSLALGIGANTAIYSFMDALLFRSLPVPKPESLVVVTWHAKPFRMDVPRSSQSVMHAMSGSLSRDASGPTGSILPFGAFERLQQVSGSLFSGLFAYHSAGKVNVIVRGEAEVAIGEYVTGEFFSALQVVPAEGRAFVPDDDRSGAPLVAVLSSRYGVRRFGSAHAAIGQPVQINSVAFTVIGVAPESFSGIDPATIPDVYVPLHTTMLLGAERAEDFFDQNYYWLDIMGRLRPGVRLADAQAALATPFEQWVRSTATTSVELENLPVLQVTNGAGGLDYLRRRFSKPVYVLLAMVGLILAIACANTANLLLARSSARRREIAVRLAIGAGRLRIIRQLLTESVVLALVSGALGVLVAFVSIETLSRLLANGQEANGQLVAVIDARLDWRVLSVTVVLSIASGLLFGLAPALQATKPSLIPALKGTSIANLHRRPRLTSMQSLIVSQLIMSLLLLVGAGLFARTLTNLQSVELGFASDHLLLFDVNAAQSGRSASQTAAFYADLRRRLSEAPGVRDATLAHASLVGAGRGLPFSVDGVPASAARILNAGPAVLKTLGIRVLRGRDLEERDTPAAPPVVVISDLFARTYFPDRDPIGRRLHFGDPPLAPDRDFEIVGIAAEAHYGSLKRDVPPVIYMPYDQTTYPPLGQMTFIVRTDADPLQYGSVVRSIVRSADARVPVTRMRTQTGEIDQMLNQEIIFARLCTAFAVLALVMACIGLYGTMAYGVSRRTPEIGIRIALGARTATVIWMVLREVCALAVVGLMISVPLALFASRLVQSFLFAVKPNDPYTVVSAVGVLVVAALVAGLGPARRASRISPAIALRAD